MNDSERDIIVILGFCLALFHFTCWLILNLRKAKRTFCPNGSFRAPANPNAVEHVSRVVGDHLKSFRKRKEESNFKNEVSSSMPDLAEEVDIGETNDEVLRDIVLETEEGIDSIFNSEVEVVYTV